MHHQIDSLVYLNRLRYLPPSEKLLFTIMLFLLSYLGGRFVQIILIIWLFIWIVVYAGIPWRFYLQLLTIPLGFGMVSLPAIALEIVWSDNLVPINFYFSPSGLIQGAELLLRAITVSSSMYFLLLTTPLIEILEVLAKLGCPSLILELLALMYRFIAILTETASNLLLAQQSRGGYSRRSRIITSLGLLVTQLFKQSLENYRQIVLGLNSRGFTGKLRFWQPIPYKSNLRYTLEALLGYSCLVFYAILKKSG
ncbi:MAG: cobalt ECF transporter T component CbiQ [Gloeocapsa sp. DLM2.Bin57]|nr:MAG: cobalt ECF transporter T component CbiQ [Gloeocapsa sp. DLM2.Bin57]